MKKTKRIPLWIAAALLLAFALWTVLLRIVDVQEIGPRDSAVGFAALNAYFHGLTGVNMTLYTITDWLGLVPIAVALSFAIFGLVQWIQRKSLFKVDKDVLLLGIFYIVVIAVYILFERVVVNFRPVLIDGYLEASYPSSTTLLVACVMPTAWILLRERIKNERLRRWIFLLIAVFTVFMVAGRLLSGVHWLSDIIGGILLSAGLVTAFCAVNNLEDNE